RQLIARAAKDNIRSIRVLQKCDFKIIDENKDFAQGRGEETEEYIFRLDGQIQQSKYLTRRQSQPPQLSRLMLPHQPRHLLRWLSFNVRRMASAIEGGCLCGGVRYRLHVRPKQGSDCHCEDCRRASAAPYVTWCSVPSKAIEVLSGELRRVSYADRLRSFASCCGTPLFIQDEVSSEWIDVTVASLDDPKTFPPEVAIWTED